MSTTELKRLLRSAIKYIDQETRAYRAGYQDPYTGRFRVRKFGERVRKAEIWLEHARKATKRSKRK